MRIIRKLGAAIATALVTAAQMPVIDVAAASPVDAASSASVYAVEARNSSGMARQGSAVAIGRDTLVTNCHVTRGATTIMVARDGRSWRATVRAADAELDLCILSAPFAVTQPAPLRDARSLSIGEAVHAAAYPSGQGLTVRAGAIVALHRHEDSHVIQVSAPFELGASGGGLFDQNGSLVGILTFKVVGGEGRYYALPADWIGRVLATAAPARPHAASGAGGAFWERPAAALPAFLAQATGAVDARHGTGASTSLERRARR